MKYLKATLCIFVVTLVLSLVSASAIDGFRSVSGIKLPTFGGTVEAATAYKSEDNVQTYYSVGTIDSLTSADINVKAKTQQGGDDVSDYITLGRGQSGQWTGKRDGNFTRGTYTLVLRREKSSVTTASHSGSWYLDLSKWNLVN